jgi:hypothetical protein
MDGPLVTVPRVAVWLTFTAIGWLAVAIVVLAVIAWA